MEDAVPLLGEVGEGGLGGAVVDAEDLPAGPARCLHGWVGGRDLELLVCLAELIEPDVLRLVDVLAGGAAALHPLGDVLAGPLESGVLPPDLGVVAEAASEVALGEVGDEEAEDGVVADDLSGGDDQLLL